MKNIELELAKLLAERHLSVPKLAERIGMSKQNLYPMIKNNDMHISTLQKICDVLEVPVSYFFDDKYAIVITEAKRNKKVVVQIELEDGIDESKVLKLIMGKEFVELLKK